MKTTAIACLPLMIALTLPAARADSAAKAEKIEQIFKVTKVEETQQRVFDQIQSMMLSQVNSKAGASQELTKRLMDLVAQKMSWQKMKPVYIQLYDETFTEEDLDGMLRFYESPAGKAMLDKMPVLMSKTMALVQQQMQELMPDIQKTTRDYMEQHKGSAPNE